MNITITAVDTASTTNQYLEEFAVATESGCYEIFARLSQAKRFKDALQHLNS